MAGNASPFVKMITSCVSAVVMTVPINWHLTMLEAANISSDGGVFMTFAGATKTDSLRQVAAGAGVTKVLAFEETFEDWCDA